jgi:hypothetical protein
MSQIYKTIAATPPPPGFVEFLEGNDLVAVGPNASDIIFVPGNGALTSGVSTAGNIVSTNTSANTITFSPTQAQFMTNRTVVTTTPYAVLPTDYYLAVTTASLAITIDLPASPGTNRLIIIKDLSGNAAVNNITVTPAAGTIDGLANYIINSNYQAIQLLYDGTNWEVY